MPNIFLVRHATPDWSRADLLYYQPPGPPLTPQGLSEAQALAAYLQHAGVNAIYSSPLERCLKTAVILSQTTGSPIEVLDDLKENQPGEVPEAVKARMCNAFQSACEAVNENGTAVLVSHGGPIGALLLALGMPRNTLDAHRIYDHRNPLPPTGVWQASRSSAEQSWTFQLVYQPNGNLQGR
jgi:broad specificity phosphatase PhoE